jgi:surface antigen
MSGKDEDVTTGSVAAQNQPQDRSQASQAHASVLPAALDGGAQPSASDLAYARAALSDVLSRGGKDASAPWENPATGARGTVTPIASAYSQDGRVCRDFLASYVKPGTESWLQGEACRVRPGNWEVRTLKPWKRSGPA